MNLERIARRHRKLEERRRIVERCEGSGLSRSEFARRHRILLSSLQQWLAEARNAPKEVPAVVFREVAASPPLIVSTSPTWAIEIVRPDGATVRCRDGLSVDDLLRLLREPRC